VREVLTLVFLGAIAKVGGGLPSKSEGERKGLRELFEERPPRPRPRPREDMVERETGRGKEREGEN
jgi:hypothetical protein